MRHKVPWLPEAKLAKMLGEAVTQIRVPTQVATGIVAALEADQSKLMLERKEELDSANRRLKEIEQQKLETYRDLKRGVIDEALWFSLRDGWSGRNYGYGLPWRPAQMPPWPRRSNLCAKLSNSANALILNGIRLSIRSGPKSRKQYF